MTDEQIFEVAKTCGFIEMIGERDDGTDGVYYECWEEQLLKFAKALWAEGFKVGVEYGYDEGWEGSKVSTKMTWSSNDD